MKINQRLTASNSSSLVDWTPYLGSVVAEAVDDADIAAAEADIGTVVHPVSKPFCVCWNRHFDGDGLTPVSRRTAGTGRGDDRSPDRFASGPVLGGSTFSVVAVNAKADNVDGLCVEQPSGVSGFGKLSVLSIESMTSTQPFSLSKCWTQTVGRSRSCCLSEMQAMLVTEWKIRSHTICFITISWCVRSNQG